MKKIVLPLITVVGLMFLQATQKTENEAHSFLTEEAGPELPPNVKTIVEQKCYGCHNVESKSDKAKEKLDWDEFEASKKSKQLAKMKKINETLTEGDMPPAKFLERKPEGKLTADELATLLDWSAGKKKGE